MGREETAKAERAEMRRAVVDEAIGRLGEFEERLATQKKVINNQGRALEALANMITAMVAENQARDVLILKLSLRFWQRWYLAIAGYVGKLRAVGAAAVTEGRRRDRGFTVTKLEDPESWDPSAKPAAMTADDDVYAKEIEKRKAGGIPKPSHIHQYVKDGPFLYACTVPECGKRATLEEIAAESEYLRALDAAAGGTDADQSSAKLRH